MPTNTIILYRELIAIYSEIHTKTHKYTQRRNVEKAVHKVTGKLYKRLRILTIFAAEWPLKLVLLIT
jgi:hypothetical protein